MPSRSTNKSPLLYSYFLLESASKHVDTQLIQEILTSIALFISLASYIPPQLRLSSFLRDLFILHKLASNDSPGAQTPGIPPSRQPCPSPLRSPRPARCSRSTSRVSAPVAATHNVAARTALRTPRARERGPRPTPLKRRRC